MVPPPVGTFHWSLRSHVHIRSLARLTRCLRMYVYRSEHVLGDEHCSYLFRMALRFTPGRTCGGELES